MIDGLHQNQSELSKTFAEAFTVVILNSSNTVIKDDSGKYPLVKDEQVKPFYGESAEVEKIKLDFRERKEEVAVYVGVSVANHRGEESLASGNVVIEGKLLLTIWATYSLRATKFCEELLKESGYITEEGALGKPGKAPWGMGNIEVLRFDPVGGFNNRTVDAGDMHMNQQLIDFAIYDKNIQDV